MEQIKIKVDGKEYDVRVEETEEGKILVHCGKDIYEVETEHNKAQALFSKQAKKDLEEQGQGIIAAPLPGTVTDIKVKKGDAVTEGQPLIKLIAMKMENEIAAQKSGTVKEVKVKKDAKVNKDDILIVLD